MLQVFKTSLYFIFFLAQLSWASGDNTHYLVYTNQTGLNLALHNLHYTNLGEVYSNIEKNVLRRAHKSTDIIKISIDNRDYNQFKQQLFKAGIHFEKRVFANLQSVPTDLYFSRQWGMQNRGEVQRQRVSDINTIPIVARAHEDANALNTQHENQIIKVAVLDSGIDYNHPELLNNLYKTESECRKLQDYKRCLDRETDDNICYQEFLNIDTDNNGYPMDCSGWSFAGQNLPSITTVIGSPIIQEDNLGHGTHVAGIIGATRNRRGITGVATKVKILPVQVNGTIEGRTDLTPIDVIAKGLLYAIQNGAHVVNMSLGWSIQNDSIMMREMVELAYERKIILIVAGGNHHNYTATYPCSYNHVICVGAHDVTGNIASFSNYGTAVDLFAPGVDILSTYPLQKRSRRFYDEPGYEILTGTSQAAPFVSGVVAKLLSEGFSPEDVRIKLLKGTRVSPNNTLAKNGNLDYEKARLITPQSYIYPLNKIPALIQWNKDNRSTKLRFINYGKSVQNVSIRFLTRTNNLGEKLELVTSHFQFENWNQKEVKEIEINFLNNHLDIDSDIFADVTITSSDEEKTYPVYLKAVTVMADTVKPSVVQSLELVLPFDMGTKNITSLPRALDDQKMPNFLAYSIKSDGIKLNLIKNQNNQYQIKNELQYDFKNAMLLNTSTIDINQDGKEEYVVIFLESIDEKNRFTRFVVIDENGEKSNIQICPENKLSTKTQLFPLNFIWAKHQNKFVPAWIDYGARPESQVPATTPWAPPFQNTRKNQLYLLTESGLKSDPYFFTNDVQAISFLTQTPQEKSQGQFHVIAGTGPGHLKRYHILKYSENIVGRNNPIEIFFNPYVSLIGQRYFNLWDNSDPGLFFSIDTTGGGKRIVTTSLENNQVLTEQFVITNADPLMPIQYVLATHSDYALFQTSHSIGVYDRGLQTSTFTDAKIQILQAKFKRLNFANALYVTSQDSTEFSSELIMAKTDHQHKYVPYRSARFNILATQSCNEVTPIVYHGQDFLSYLCPGSNSFVFYPINF